MTHSLVVMHMALGCDIEAGDVTIDLALLPFITIEDPAEDKVFEVLGRIAIGGAIEDEDVGVETDGEAAEAGLDTAFEEPWLTAVVIESVLNGPASAFPGAKPGFGSVVIAAILVGGLVNRLGFASRCSGVF
jgi:hypothetical protein